MLISKREIRIKHIPATIWGISSRKLYLYIHGQGGNKDEASQVAEIACTHGYQILSIDLPEHGVRKNEVNCFDPWHIIPELKAVMKFASGHWEQISLFANSIGAWFSMLSFESKCLKNCMFVSPVLDMKELILKMMNWANVTEAMLERELIIPTSFGQTLSLEYWQYTLEHPIEIWKAPTNILYGENDNLVDLKTVERFAYKNGCNLSIMKNGEHWFHTEGQLDFMCNWFKENLTKKH